MLITGLTFRNWQLQSTVEHIEPVVGGDGSDTGGGGGGGGVCLFA